MFPYSLETSAIAKIREVIARGGTLNQKGRYAGRFSIAAQGSSGTSPLQQGDPVCMEPGAPSQS